MHVLESKNEQITLEFGNQNLFGSNYYHTGIDLVKKYNSLDYIIAAQTGKVTKVRNDINGFLNNSYGNYIKLSHANGYETFYAHLKKDSILVKEGQIVNKGQRIAYMGNTGYAFGAHLHFEIIKDTNKINPKSFLFGNDIIPALVVNNTPTSNAVNTSFYVGQKVVLKQSAINYATGEKIPDRYKSKEYTIMQVADSKVLLKELYSWVKKTDVE